MAVAAPGCFLWMGMGPMLQAWPGIPRSLAACVACAALVTAEDAPTSDEEVAVDAAVAAVQEAAADPQPAPVAETVPVAEPQPVPVAVEPPLRETPGWRSRR